MSNDLNSGGLPACQGCALNWNQFFPPIQPINIYSPTWGMPDLSPYQLTQEEQEVLSHLRDA